MVLFCNCSDKPNSEIYQSDRNNVLKVKDKIHEIVIDEPMIGYISRLYIINDYFVIIDVKSYDNLIKVFDKKDFSI